MDLKAGLEHFKAQFDELERAARGLENQNIADIIQGVGARIGQILEHPDVDKVAQFLNAGHDEAGVKEAVAKAQEAGTLQPPAAPDPNIPPAPFPAPGAS